MDFDFDGGGIITNINDELRTIEENFSVEEIYLKYGIASLMYYEAQDFQQLIVKINVERDKYSDTQDRLIFILLYRKVYLAQRKKLLELYDAVKNRTTKIIPEPTREEMQIYTNESWKYLTDISNLENVYLYAENRIKYAIFKTEEELYTLRKYPSVYYNYKSNYVGGVFSYRYDDEIIIYDKVNIISDGMHHFRLYCNDSSKASDKRALLNIMAYLNGCPNFEFLANSEINNKLDELYYRFDLLDCIRLRNPNYLKANVEDTFHLELPIIKNIKGYKMIVFEKLPHEGILDLYHASLKQFEPLPRCVFLYRVFEYAASYHYKPTIMPETYTPEAALNYYLSLALNYNCNPLYYMDWKKQQLSNYFTVLKHEAKVILEEWRNTPYLARKTPGEIIYLTGRNFTAHGASGNMGDRNMQYDYDKNYLHINNINIVLEIIARYVVELLNPKLQNVVERRKQYYMERYKKIMENKEK